MDNNLPECWSLFGAAIKFSDSPVLLWGPPGIGKSYGILAAARAAGKVCHRMALTEETSSEEPRGRFAPAPVRNQEGDVIGTVLSWEDGPLLRALRAGEWMLWDDLHRIGPECMGIIYLAAESRESLSLTLPTGERIGMPGTGYRCLATANVPPNEILDEALLSRFVLRIHIDQPHPAALELFPFNWRGAIAASVSLADPARRTTLRDWLTFSQIEDESGDRDLAARLVWGKARGREVINALRISAGADEGEA